MGSALEQARSKAKQRDGRSKRFIQCSHTMLLCARRRAFAALRRLLWSNFELCGSAPESEPRTDPRHTPNLRHATPQERTRSCDRRASRSRAREHLAVSSRSSRLYSARRQRARSHRRRGLRLRALRRPDRGREGGCVASPASPFHPRPRVVTAAPTARTDRSDSSRRL